MKMSKWFLLSLLLLAACTEETGISGKFEGGMRILDLTNNTQPLLTVYRGDYIYPRLVDGSSFSMIIPDLAINKTYPAGSNETRYIKMTRPGSYAFSAGSIKGELRVIEYTSANYQALSTVESRQVIENVNPLILDVRTTFEYDQAHIPGTTLIPLNELQGRMNEIQEYKNQPVIIYCATGSRSTAAARLLIEAGFTTIYNMRYGISSWLSQGYPVNSK